MSFCIKWIWNCIIKFYKGAMIVAPEFPDELVHRVFFVMQAYLTNGWRVSFTYAAGIMNFWEGMSLVFPTLFQFLADRFLGNFTVAVISTVSSSVGIAMVALSVPSILDHNGGRCRNPVPESCLNHTEKAVFYTGMVVTAIGRAGISFSLDALLHDEQEDQEEPQRRTRHSSNCIPKAVKRYLEFAVSVDKFIMSYLIGPLLLMIWITKWKLLFGLPAIYSAYVNIFWVVFGFCLFKRLPPQGSPITSVFFKTKSTLSPEEEETAKFVVRMIPISTTFILCWTVSSIGNTYFVEQANRMNRRVGNWTVPLLALQLPVTIFKMYQSLYLYLFFKIDKDWIRSKLKMDLPIAGIGGAMLYSVLCCITAAKMEMKRLGVVREHHLSDDEVVTPMHAAWLLFQFFLLAGVDSFLRKSVEEFYKDQAPQHLKDKLERDETMAKRYLKSAVDFVAGLGFMASVLSVYVVGKLSEVGGNPNWFQYTLNKSRLDCYYWVLAALSALNLLVFHLVVAMKYKRR